MTDRWLAALAVAAFAAVAAASGGRTIAVLRDSESIGVDVIAAVRRKTPPGAGADTVSPTTAGTATATPDASSRPTETPTPTATAEETSTTATGTPSPSSLTGTAELIDGDPIGGLTAPSRLGEWLRLDGQPRSADTLDCLAAAEENAICFGLAWDIPDDLLGGVGNVSQTDRAEFAVEFRIESCETDS